MVEEAFMRILELVVRGRGYQKNKLEIGLF